MEWVASGVWGDQGMPKVEELAIPFFGYWTSEPIILDVSGLDLDLFVGFTLTLETETPIEGPKHDQIEQARTWFLREFEEEFPQSLKDIAGLEVVGMDKVSGTAKVRAFLRSGVADIHPTYNGIRNLAIGLDDSYHLMRYLPPYWHDVKEMKQIQKTLGAEAKEVRKTVSAILEQFFVDTATWGLTLWERELNIKPDAKADYEARRTEIKARLRGTETTTTGLIKRIAKAFTGSDVEVDEYYNIFHVVLRFLRRGGQPNLPALRRVLEEVLPCHLTLDMEFTWATWRLLKDCGITWGMIKDLGLTWEDLKKFECDPQLVTWGDIKARGLTWEEVKDSEMTWADLRRYQGS